MVEKLGLRQQLGQSPNQLEAKIIEFDKSVWFHVYQLADTLEGFGIQLPDAAQEARIAVVDAIENYNPNKRTRLSTFVSNKIRWRLLDHIRNQAPIARSYQTKLREMRNFEAEYEAQQGRSPSNEEIAQNTGLLVETIIELKQTPREYTMSDLHPDLHDRIMSGRHPSVRDEDNLTTPEGHVLASEESLADEERLKLLSTVIENLNERSAAIIRMYYFDGLDQGEIAKRLGIHRSRVSQLQSRALKELRELLEDLPEFEEEKKQRKPKERKNYQYFDLISPDDLKALLDKKGRSLTEREITVLRLRSGLADGRVWTLQEIADEIGLKNSQSIYLITREALGKLIERIN